MTAVAPPAVCKADQPCLPFPLTSIYSLLRYENTYCGNVVEGGQRREELPKSDPDPRGPIWLDSLLMEGRSFSEYSSENLTSGTKKHALREAVGKTVPGGVKAI